MTDVVKQVTERNENKKQCIIRNDYNEKCRQPRHERKKQKMGNNKMRRARDQNKNILFFIENT